RATSSAARVSARGSIESPRKRMDLELELKLELETRADGDYCPKRLQWRVREGNVAGNEAAAMAIAIA
ncbi:MAG: hypothetical protein KGL43_25140, partial [Burkholderiales bacterium]|nr:hypothetical protein [Burkholderiales bacterium]